jgi:hypothetical protein
LEVRGNSMKLLVDGAFMLDATDNGLLSPGRVGLWSDRVQTNVRSFRVIVL